MPFRNAAHGFHDDLVVIHSQVGGHEQRRQLILRGRDLVVLRLARHTHAPERVVELVHKREHRLRRGGIVLVGKLLPLGRRRAEQRPPGIHEVLAAQKRVLVHEEIFLLPADGRRHTARPVVPQQAQHAHRLAVERLHGAQQRRLFIERLAGKRAKRRGDAQAARTIPVPLQKRRARAIPRGVAARLKRRAQPAGGKRRPVRLALDQRLGGKGEDRRAIQPAKVQKCVALLGGGAGHRLEPVRKMRGAALQRPLHHR